ncbi:hypothetical protein BsWGS_22433 [Bradybaena similaris]
MEDKKRRVSYEAGFKLKVILYAEDHGNRQAAREFGVAESNIRLWRQHRKMIFTSKMTRKKFTGPQKGRHPEVDEEVLKFIQDRRENALPVTSDTIRSKANEVATAHGISSQVFKASRGWVDRFMKRMSLSLRHHATICQQFPTDVEDKLQTACDCKLHFDDRSMDSHSLIPSVKIKLEPACETDNIHSSAKEMTTEAQVLDMIDSNLSVSFKIEQPEVVAEHPNKDKKIPACSQIAHSLPMPEHSEMKMIKCGNMNLQLVKREPSDVLCEDKSHRFGKLIDMADCKDDNELTEHINTESRMTKNSYEVSIEHENSSQISENVSSLFEVSTKFSLTDKNYKLPNNVEIKTGKKSYKTVVCDETVNGNSYLNRKKRKYKNDKTFKCDFCNASLISAGGLKCHMRRHTGDKPYKCDVCDASFTEASGLKKHKRTHTGEKPYKCEVCDAFFIEAGNLKRHMRTHTGERPYTCDECDASFTVAGNLKTHKATHTGQKPYKCDECNASFTEAGTLKKHKRLHTGERPYTCSVCGKSFAEAGTLKKHKRTHTGEKPYRCNVCCISYAQADSLRKHSRAHTGERPYRHNDGVASSADAKTEENTHRRESLEA